MLLSSTFRQHGERDLQNHSTLVHTALHRILLKRKKRNVAQRAADYHVLVENLKSMVGSETSKKVHVYLVLELRKIHLA